MNKVEFCAKTAAPSAAPDMEKINAQSLRTLAPEEVYVFRVNACDTFVDRDYEHFSAATLAELAKAYVGRTMIADHQWKAENQTARIYDAYVEEVEGGAQLILCAYMLRTAEMQPMIDAIDAGILREVSVGCAIERAVCDICGADYCTGQTCPHVKGQEYDGTVCTVTLDGLKDVYEVSFVAVPAQPRAGVTKEFDPDADQKAGEGAPAQNEDKLRELGFEIECEAARY